MMIQFFVRGEPKPQPRPRAFARKMGDKFVARVFDCGTAEHWKAQIAVAAQPFLPAEPIAGPIALRVTFNLPRPKAHLKKDGSVKESAPLWHTSRPDLDNYVKALCDALTQVGMWRDDNQVADMSLRKQYGPQAGAFVEVVALGARKVVGE